MCRSKIPIENLRKKISRRRRKENCLFDWQIRFRSLTNKVCDLKSTHFHFRVHNQVRFRNFTRKKNVSKYEKKKNLVKVRHQRRCEISAIIFK